MTDNRASRPGSEVQLGARARSVLDALSAAPEGPRRADGRTPEEEARLQARREAIRAERRKARAEGRDDSPNAIATIPDPAAPAPQDGGSRVVPLPRREAPGRRGSPRPDVAIALPAPRAPATKARKNFVGISAWLAIALPTLLATLYFCFIASPQYVAEARFAVRGPDDGPTGGDMLGALTGIGGAGTAVGSDSFIVSQYIESTQLVGLLQKSLDLRSIYTSDKGDFLARYRPYESGDTIEHLTTFWNSVAWVYYEPISGIITFTVRSFTPEDSLKIARETIRESENLVNKLSERAREDSISLARQEQARSEMRLKFARKAIQDYRDRQGSTDPVTQATMQSGIVAGLEDKLAKAEAELTATLSFLNKDAPTVRVMKNGVDALKARIAAERAKIGTTDNKANSDKNELISASMAEYETLQTERDFAEKQYISATQAAENARIRAERQSRYLTTFVEPHLPEDTLYPARLQMIVLVLVCSTLAWAIGVLIFYGIRDHSA